MVNIVASHSLFMPEESTNKLKGFGEFAIRVKPNALTSDSSGYIKYSSSTTDESLKLVHGEWKTYTVDLSDFGDNCTEFSFVMALGNTVYFKDIVIS